MKDSHEIVAHVSSLIVCVYLCVAFFLLGILILAFQLVGFHSFEG